MDAPENERFPGHLAHHRRQRPGLRTYAANPHLILPSTCDCPTVPARLLSPVALRTACASGHHSGAARTRSTRCWGLRWALMTTRPSPSACGKLLSLVRAQLRRAYGEFAPAADANLLRRRTDDRPGSQPAPVMRRSSTSPRPNSSCSFMAFSPRPGTQPRKQILTRWGYDADVESERTVNVHISRLAKRWSAPQPPQPHPHCARHRLPPGRLNWPAPQPGCGNCNRAETTL